MVEDEADKKKKEATPQKEKTVAPLKNVKKEEVKVTETNKESEQQNPIKVEADVETVEDHIHEENSKTTINANTEVPNNVEIPTNEPTPEIPMAKPQVDKRQYDILMQAILDSNLDGFDYLEFKNSLQALDNIPMDEQTKYRSAFATASTMGLTLEKLFSTADYYKKVLEREKEKFRDALQAKVSEGIAYKEQEKGRLAQEIENKTAKIAQLNKQIDQLNAEIEEHKAQLNNKQSELDTLEDKITQTRDNFLATYDYIHDQFDSDLAKIQQYLAPK